MHQKASRICSGIEQNASSTTVLLLFLLLCMTACPSRTRPGPAEGFARVVVVPLSTERHGIDGRLELNVDARLAALYPTARSVMGDLNPWQPAVDGAAALARPLPASLRLLDSQGRTLEQEALPTSLSLLELVDVAGSRPLLLLSQYDGAGFGSYSGWLTSVIEVRNGRLQRPEVMAEGTSSSSPVRWRRGLKADWRLQTDRGQLEVLSLQCHPAQAGDDFELVFQRDVRAEEGWKRAATRKPGFWEMDQPFPPLESWP